MRHTYKLYSIMFKLQSIEEQFNEVIRKSGVKYDLDQAISGHYRLVAYRDEESAGRLPNYDIIHEDPACEDLYDKETAMTLFADIIREKHNLY